MKIALILPIVLLLVGCSGQALPVKAKALPDDQITLPQNAQNDVSDQRLGVSECGIHKVKMIEEIIPNHGFITIEYELSYERALASEFPNVGHALGVRSDSAKLLVNYCPQCREAEKKYLMLHDSK